MKRLAAMRWSRKWRMAIEQNQSKLRTRMFKAARNLAAK